MWPLMTSTWLGIVIGPIFAPVAGPGPHVAGEPGQLAHEVVVDPLVDVDPLDADAGLAGVGQAPHTAASAAAATSASSSTSSASLPPASMRTGVRFSAQAAITFLPVAVEPVNAILSTPARHSAAPVSPKPDHDLEHRALRHDLARSASASQSPTPGV